MSTGMGDDMNTPSTGTALITGASSGIGAVYADRLARRGHDLILVARNRERLDVLSKRLADETGRSVRAIVADLNDKAALARVEQLLRTDGSVTLLVNNAGIGVPPSFLDARIDQMDRMIGVNVTALVRLTYAIVPGFVKRGAGVVVNIASVVGITPELLNGVYGGTKAFVLAFTLSLHKEFSEKGIRVQVVLPGAIATDFWAISGTPLEQFPREFVMTADDAVDAALAGLDMGELVTIPSLPDVAEWEAYEAARQNMLPRLSLSSPAVRYGVPSESNEQAHPARSTGVP